MIFLVLHQAPSGVFLACVWVCRFEGKEPEALAFAIMKYDTLWSSTPKAIIQQWRRGRRGRAELVASIESLLMHAEVVDFLDGLDGRFRTPAAIGNQGVWPCMRRLLCFSLPTNRTRSATAEHTSCMFKLLKSKCTYMMHFGCLVLPEGHSMGYLFGLLLGIYAVL